MDPATAIWLLYLAMTRYGPELLIKETNVATEQRVSMFTIMHYDRI